VDAASADGGTCDVWVAQGRYHLYVASALDSLTLRSNVSIYGGFTGQETSREQRDHLAHETVLDGRASFDQALRVFHVITAIGTRDATVDGFTVTGGEALGMSQDLDDRGGGLLAYSAGNLGFRGCRFVGNTAQGCGGGAYLYKGTGLRFVACAFEDNEAACGGGMCNDPASPLISGCTFTRNGATGAFTSEGEWDPEKGGGGMINLGPRHWLQPGPSSNPQIEDCLFLENWATYDGGGISNIWSSSPSVSRAYFVGNEARDGAGMHCRNESSPAVRSCDFIDNLASGSGGGLALTNSSIATVQDSRLVGNLANYGGAIANSYDNDLPFLLDRCILAGNRASSGGGAMRNDIAMPLLASSVFAGNVTDGNGGAILNVMRSKPSLVGCTLVGNRASSGGGLYNMTGGGGSSNICYPSINSSVVFGNSPDSFARDAYPSVTTVTYSDIEGGSPGTGNISLDPLFAHPGLQGIISAVAYDPARFVTLLEDASASLIPGELAGRFLQYGGLSRWLYLVDNSATTITVLGNAEEVPLGSAYVVYDLRLDAASPCIDAGDGQAAPPLDVEGFPRLDGPGANVGLGPPWADMGAYEHQ
jgi:hypothetical protein